MTSFLISIIIGLLLLNGLMYLQQPNMIFYPIRGLEQTPDRWGLDYEDASFITEDGVQLHGWYLPNEDSDRVLLFFHGNAGNISHRRESIEIFRDIGLNVLIFDYRGYGYSLGRPSENGLYMDAQAAWKYLVNEKGYKPEQIILFGRSLGGAVAAWLAAEVVPRGLILESTLSSARDFARQTFRFMANVIYVRYRFDTANKVAQVNCPVLVLHSPQDEIMPYILGEKVFAAAPQPKHFIQMRGDHNSGFYLSQPDYQQQLQRWIQAL